MLVEQTAPDKSALPWTSEARAWPLWSKDWQDSRRHVLAHVLQCCAVCLSSHLYFTLWDRFKLAATDPKPSRFGPLLFGMPSVSLKHISLKELNLDLVVFPKGERFLYFQIIREDQCFAQGKQRKICNIKSGKGIGCLGKISAIYPWPLSELPQ